jgi:hypothetical protein
LIDEEMDSIKVAVFPRQVREEMDKIYQPPEGQYRTPEGQYRIPSASSAAPRMQAAGQNILAPQSREQSASLRQNNNQMFSPNGKESKIEEGDFLDELGGSYPSQPGQDFNSRIQSASVAGGRFLDSVDSRKAPLTKRPDDEVIPVLDRNHKKIVIPEFRDEGERYGEVERNTGDEYLQAEDIELNKLAFARMLSPFLSIPIVKGLFSKNWNYREQAINAIRMQLTKEKSGPK